MYGPSPTIRATVAIFLIERLFIRTAASNVGCLRISQNSREISFRKSCHCAGGRRFSIGTACGGQNGSHSVDLPEPGAPHTSSQFILPLAASCDLRLASEAAATDRFVVSSIDTKFMCNNQPVALSLQRAAPHHAVRGNTLNWVRFGQRSIRFAMKQLRTNLCFGFLLSEQHHVRFLVIALARRTASSKCGSTLHPCDTAIIALKSFGRHLPPNPGASLNTAV